MLPKSPETSIVYLTSDNSDSKAIYIFSFWVLVQIFFFYKKEGKQIIS